MTTFSKLTPLFFLHTFILRKNRADNISRRTTTAAAAAAAAAANKNHQARIIINRARTSRVKTFKYFAHSASR
jgi:hypothetical protein